MVIYRFEGGLRKRRGGASPATKNFIYKKENNIPTTKNFIYKKGDRSSLFRGIKSVRGIEWSDILLGVSGDCGGGVYKVCIVLGLSSVCDSNSGQKCVKSVGGE